MNDVNYRYNWVKNMVVRIWHGVVPRENGYYFNKYLNKTRINDITISPGNLGIQVLRRVEHDKTHFILISFWESYVSDGRGCNK